MSATMSSTVEAFSRADRSGIGICLSGGGFRASLFHLGAVRRLHEWGFFRRRAGLARYRVAAFLRAT